MQAVKWLLPYVTPYKFRLALAYLLDVIFTILSLLNPYISGMIVSRVIQGGEHELLPLYLAVMAGNILFRSVLRYLFLMIFETTSQQVLFSLRRDLYERLHNQNYSFFDKNRVGDTMSRMTGDLEAIRGFLAFDLFSIPESILLFLSAIIMMFTINPLLAASLLLIAPVMMFTAFKQAREIKPAFRNVREQFSHLNSVCEENIGGNRLVKAFTREEYETDKFTKANQAYYDSNTGTARVWSKYMPIIETCAGALPMFTLLIGSLLVIGGRMEIWQIVTFNGYLWMITNSTRMFGYYVNSTQNCLTSLEKVHDMMRKRIYIANPDGSARTAPLDGAVEFRHVDFSYNRHDPHPLVLKDITFRAEKGWTVGIVGQTGAGKTTLAQLIGRYYDAIEGEVLMDGVNVKDYDLQILRRGIAVAMQDVFLFSDTVEGNIAFGVPDAPMKTVSDAAIAADADGFIRRMPEGYDTIVGERGVGLSGGQKQRLSLARALAADPAILILDDITSAVDMETEQRIQAELRDLSHKRTTFIIAHRLLSVKAADLILVLENGAITERGTHETLMAQNGYYAQMFREQQGVDGSLDKVSGGQTGQWTDSPVDIKEGGEAHGA